MKKFACLIFDLDDTLVDTTGSMLKPAIDEALVAMQKAGLPGTKDDLSQQWTIITRQGHRQGNIHSLVARYFSPETLDFKRIVEAGEYAFYHRDVKEEIDLIPGGRKILEELKQDYLLYLVTSGSSYTQLQKIEKLKLQAYFVKIYIQDPLQHQNKAVAFAEILKQTQCKPQQFLVIGNSLVSEIKAGIALGFCTCWVKNGEHHNLSPQDQSETPDYVISHLSQLKDVCKL